MRSRSDGTVYSGEAVIPEKTAGNAFSGGVGIPLDSAGNAYTGGVGIPDLQASVRDLKQKSPSEF